MGRLRWEPGEIAEVTPETPRVKSLTIDLGSWRGHHAGQHVDLRLTAEDGYQAVRSYSVSSPPEAGRVTVTVERIDDGEVSPYLVDEARSGYFLEVRGPIGGYFVWEPERGGPLFLVAGGSGVVPLASMIRHRAAVDSEVPVRLRYSSRTPEDAIFREELEGLAEVIQPSRGRRRPTPPAIGGVSTRAGARDPLPPLRDRARADRARGRALLARPARGEVPRASRLAATRPRAPWRRAPPARGGRPRRRSGRAG